MQSAIEFYKYFSLCFSPLMEIIGCSIFDMLLSERAVTNKNELKAVNEMCMFYYYIRRIWQIRSVKNKRESIFFCSSYNLTTE